MTEEIWKPISSAEGFAVSNLGRVKHLAHDTTFKMGRKKYTRHYEENILSSRMKEFVSSIPFRHCGKYFKEVRINYCSLCVAELVLNAFTDKKVYYCSKIEYKDGNPENCCLDNLDYDESNNIVLDEPTINQFAFVTND